MSSSDLTALTHKISEVRSRIVHACERAKRDPSAVKLLLASKTQTPLTIRDAFHAGVSLFGENKAQEFTEKLPSLSDLPIEWHFIGQLQSNKVKNILPHVKLIHSLDRMSLAEELQKQAEKLNLEVNVLIEVNSSGEAAKGGLSPAQVIAFIESIQKFNRIKVQGLMTVAVDGNASTADQAVRDCFRTTRELLDQVRTQFGTQTIGHELSMGMSGDFELAIEEGATLVRIGSTVFGKRV